MYSPRRSPWKVYISYKPRPIWPAEASTTRAAWTRPPLYWAAPPATAPPWNGPPPPTLWCRDRSLSSPKPDRFFRDSSNRSTRICFRKRARASPAGRPCSTRTCTPWRGPRGSTSCPGSSSPPSSPSSTCPTGSTISSGRPRRLTWRRLTGSERHHFTP